jgi:predicted nucleotidyltransferase
VSIALHPAILGLKSHWQASAVPHAVECHLPSGILIRAASPPYLLATKLEAFAGRGSSDPIASRAFEDVITLLDARAEIVQEIHTASTEVRAYLARQLAALQLMPDFLTIVAAMLRPDRASQARVEAVVLPRLREIASSG